MTEYPEHDHPSCASRGSFDDAVLRWRLDTLEIIFTYLIANEGLQSLNLKYVRVIEGSPNNTVAFISIATNWDSAVPLQADIDRLRKVWARGCDDGTSSPAANLGWYPDYMWGWWRPRVNAPGRTRTTSTMTVTGHGKPSSKHYGIGIGRPSRIPNRNVEDYPPDFRVVSGSSSARRVRI